MMPGEDCGCVATATVILSLCPARKAECSSTANSAEQPCPTTMPTDAWISSSRRMERRRSCIGMPEPGPDYVFASLVHRPIRPLWALRFDCGSATDGDRRARFMRELLRVGKTVYIDCPNGAFPIDFWHSDAPGGARVHSRREGFLPTFREIEALVPDAIVEALSPYKRLQFRQAAQHWYGRLLARPAELFFRWMPRWIAKSALNPFLVVRLECGDASRRSPTRQR